MKKQWGLCCAVGLVVGICASLAQEWDDTPSLNEFSEDIEYAELLNAVRLTAAQLEELHGMQTTCLDMAVLTPELAGAFEQLRDGILAGKSNAAAAATLGPLQQTVQEAQGNMHRTLQGLSVRLRDLLTEEQRVSLFLFNSPARAVAGYAQGLRSARKAPDEHWQRFRKHAVQGLSQACIQAGEKQTSAETIEGLLDLARSMPDAEFETARKTLVSEWTELLMPGLMKRASDAKVRDARLTWTCRRLLTYARGQTLVEIKLEALQKE